MSGCVYRVCQYNCVLSSMYSKSSGERVAVKCTHTHERTPIQLHAIYQTIRRCRVVFVLRAFYATGNEKMVYSLFYITMKCNDTHDNIFHQTLRTERTRQRLHYIKIDAHTTHKDKSNVPRGNYAIEIDEWVSEWALNAILLVEPFFAPLFCWSFDNRTRNECNCNRINDENKTSNGW